MERIRNYAVTEPSYTIAFAAWEMGLSPGTVSAANYELLRLGIVHKIERRSGPLAAVYAYRPIPGDAHSPRRRGEVRSGQHTVRAVSTPIPGTGKPIGPSGKPSPKRSARRQRRKK